MIHRMHPFPGKRVGRGAEKRIALGATFQKLKGGHTIKGGEFSEGRGS